jgi:type II secretory pathway pseudopilin PulG
VEVIVAVAILSTAIVFVFRSFTTSIAANALSQNITRACLALEAALWEIEQKYPQLESAGICPDKQFDCDYKITDIAAGLKKIDFKIAWQEDRTKKYSLDFATYFLPKKER